MVETGRHENGDYIFVECTFDAMLRRRAGFVGDRQSAEGSRRATGIYERKKEMSYDTKCYELAEQFLDGASEPEKNTESNRCQLAQRIQDSIEDFFQEKAITT